MPLWTVRSTVFWLSESVGPGSRTFLGLGDIVCWLEGLDAIHLDLKWLRRNQSDSSYVPAEADNSQKLVFGLKLTCIFPVYFPFVNNVCIFRNSHKLEISKLELRFARIAINEFSENF